MTTDRPVVSIVVRTKDRPRLLRDALHSIAEQTYRPLEVVLVNDGGQALSEPELRVILADVPLRMVVLAESQGRARAGNEGIAAAQGRYLGFLDDDDRLLPDHVHVLTACLEEAEHRICYSDTEICQRRFDAATGRFELSEGRVFASKDFSFPELLCENYIPLISILFDRQALAETGGFDTSLEIYEDWDLLLRLGRVHPFYHIPRVTAQYVQWSPERQAAQTELTMGLQVLSYDQVISKHSAAFTPTVARSLLRALKERDQLRSRLDDVQARLGDAEARLGDAESRLGELQRRVEEGQRRTEQERAVFRNELERVSQLASRAEQDWLQRTQRLETELGLIKSSRAWRSIQRYGQLRNALFPPGGATMRLLARGRAGMAQLKLIGVQGLKRQLNGTPNIAAPPAKTEYPHVPLDEAAISLEAPDASLNIRASIIVPTRNAGKEFQRTLSKLKNQWGVAAVELLIVDSGSTDDTVRWAREAGASVIEIEPDSFHHAETRNLAAEQASGDVLVFTVQDAAPAGNDWLYRLIRPIVDDRVDAVSTRQVPRADADLFALWATWGHTEWLGFGAERVRSARDYAKWERLDAAERRRAIHLDNVCTAIRKDLFLQQRFNGTYGEDIDLGKRLLLSGHRLLFQLDNAVVHSHTRSPSYFFRRSFVDAVRLAEILDTPRGTHPTEAVMGAVAWGYPIFSRRVALWADTLCSSSVAPPAAVEALLHELRLAFIERTFAEGDYAGCDTVLSQLLQPFDRGVPPGELVGLLEEPLYGDLGALARYLRAFPAWPWSPAEVAAAMHKFFGLSAGRFAAMAGAQLAPALLRGI